MKIEVTFIKTHRENSYYFVSTDEIIGWGELNFLVKLEKEGQRESIYFSNTDLTYEFEAFREYGSKGDKREFEPLETSSWIEASSYQGNSPREDYPIAYAIIDAVMEYRSK